MWKTKEISWYSGAGIIINLDWYKITIADGVRPDIPILRKSVANYQDGLQNDIYNLKTIFAVA